MGAREAFSIVSVRANAQISHKRTFAHPHICGDFSVSTFDLRIRKYAQLLLRTIRCAARLSHQPDNRSDSSWPPHDWTRTRRWKPAHSTTQARRRSWPAWPVRSSKRRTEAISSMEQPPATITTMLSGVSTSMNRARFKVLTSVPSTPACDIRRPDRTRCRPASHRS